MPFELGAKKAGLSLVRAFLHSVEGARPYTHLHPALSHKLYKNAMPSITNSKPTAMEKWSTSKVPPHSPSHRIPRRRLPLPRRQKVIFFTRTIL